MTDFAHAFLLLFGQLAFGGILALSVPGFHDIERGFFKSTACVYLGCGLLIFAGKLSLAYTAGWEAAGTGRLVETAAWLLFCLPCGLYTATLWGDRFALRARAYLLTLAAGLLAVGLSANPYRAAPFLSVETVVYALSFFVSAAMLGAVATGMSLGHWYLIEVDLPLDPFRRVFKFYAGTIVVQIVGLLVGLLVLYAAGSEATGAKVRTLWADHQTLVWMRIGLGPLASLGVAYLIWRTLKIPQTMAATGLFYVAILTAIVGEFLGRFVLFRTGLPF